MNSVNLKHNYPHQTQSYSRIINNQSYKWTLMANHIYETSWSILLIKNRMRSYSQYMHSHSPNMLTNLCAPLWSQNLTTSLSHATIWTHSSAADLTYLLSATGLSRDMYRHSDHAKQMIYRLHSWKVTLYAHESKAPQLFIWFSLVCYPNLLLISSREIRVGGLDNIKLSHHQESLV